MFLSGRWTIDRYTQIYRHIHIHRHIHRQIHRQHQSVFPQITRAQSHLVVGGRRDSKDIMMAFRSRIIIKWEENNQV